VNAEDHWGADTVALGQRSDADEPQPPRRRRVSRPKLSIPVLRVFAVIALALAIVLAVISLLGQGSDSEPAPIREGLDQAPRVVVKPSMRMRRRKPLGGSRAKSRDTGGGSLENEREPKANAKLKLDPPTSVAPTPAPDGPSIEAAPPSQAAPAPTPPAAEFGL